MAFLTLDQSLDMNKVVLSVWLRIPKVSADEIKAITPGFFWGYRVMLGVIPLISWGEQKAVSATGIVSDDTGYVDVSGTPYVTAHTETRTIPQSMSYIGVQAGSDVGPPTLEVHIQTKDNPTATGLAFIYTGFTTDGVDHIFNDIFNSSNPSNGKPVPINFQYTGRTDVSYIYTDHPDYLGNSAATSSGTGAGSPALTPDEWHHLLISWELLGHSNMGGASKMWCAIDDENQTGSDLPAMNDSSYMAPNDHKAWVPYNWDRNDTVSASISISSIPSDPSRIPGPASITYADGPGGETASREPIVVVELAELQIFTGVTLDTSNEVARRAFIDFPADGENPNDDPENKHGMKPVNPQKAEEFMGRRPDVLLHGNTNWQQGKNTGSLGRDSEGNDIETGQFRHVGTITTYKPEPELGK